MGKDGRSKEIRRDRDLKNVGPTSYTKTFHDKKKEPQFSMGAKLESSLVKKEACASPEPGRYDPSHKLAKT